MPAINNASPEIMPVLSRGKHRSARRGACFMEYASYLAGERWSDHPACTHPALASLARLVNDWTSDAERSRLGAMIPSVIGLVGDDDDDERVELALAVRAAAFALPVASEARQRALAVGLIRCETQVASIDPDGILGVHATVQAALDKAPTAEQWAREQLAALRRRQPRTFAPMYDAIVNVAVAGIGEACIDDADERLRNLLASAIDECKVLLGRDETPRETRVPSTAPRQTGAHLSRN